MMKSGKFQNIALGVLFVAVITLTIAYAAMSQQLNITANATVGNKTASWNIFFAQNSGQTNICTAGGSAVVGTQPTLAATTVSGLSATLKAPGDTITCKFAVKNTGILNGKITALTHHTPTFSGSGDSKTADETLVQGNISYSLTYDETNNTSAVAQNDTLDAGETKKVKFVISYSGNDLPVNDVVVGNLGTVFTYTQY